MSTKKIIWIIFSEIVWIILIGTITIISWVYITPYLEAEIFLVLIGIILIIGLIILPTRIYKLTDEQLQNGLNNWTVWDKTK